MRKHIQVLSDLVITDMCFSYDRDAPKHFCWLHFPENVKYKHINQCVFMRTVRWTKHCTTCEWKGIRYETVWRLNALKIAWSIVLGIVINNRKKGNFQKYKIHTRRHSDLLLLLAILENAVFIALPSIVLRVTRFLNPKVQKYHSI